MMQSVSSGKRHWRPPFQIARPQQWRGPPGRDEHPLPSHWPQEAGQHTIFPPLSDRTPFWHLALAITAEASGAVLEPASAGANATSALLLAKGVIDPPGLLPSLLLPSAYLRAPSGPFWLSPLPHVVEEKACDHCPPMMHGPGSSAEVHALPSLQMAFPQHSVGPPGRSEQPKPSHVPHPLGQQTEPCPPKLRTPPEHRDDWLLAAAMLLLALALAFA